jgi:hypothetical protein
MGCENVIVRALIIFFFLFVAGAASAQQMVVIKKGRIIARYNLGDEIYYVLKGDKQKYHAAILQIREFEFITLQKDTVRFLEVANLKFKNKGAKNYLKSSLLGAAALTALSFALEPAYGDKNPQALKGMRYAAGAGLISTLFVLATSRSHIKLIGFKRLKFINYDSPLYQ